MNERPEIGSVYHIEGDDILLTGEVFAVNEVGDGHYDVFVTCELTGDEWAICTKDAVFTRLSY